MQWLAFDSLVNARDVGGIPTVDGGRILPRRLIRSDNLQALTPDDIQRLRDLGVTDIVDLRSAFEVQAEGPGPLDHRAEFTIHRHSFFVEQVSVGAGAPGATGAAGDTGGIEASGANARDELPGDVLPWAGERPHTIQVEDGFASSYLSFLADRPESVLAALRAVAYADGAALVHCAAGKDRTGTTVALALMIAGADVDAVVEDYAASTERIDLILARLLARETYAENLSGRPASSHHTRPESMRAFLGYAEERFGGVEPMLGMIGWTPADTAQMRVKLRG
ncbi:protein-tyrosine-phosphatase [Raineyella fluvialis]|uniref:Protein-tyrosine-phosphatase n=1 Tax=Raineyella fluvialis TaxID=2662261 RepID=A0A5Q2FL73_9ACTN|nr:protein-tyrosine-phosphatase [Raineyella fluvialis]